MEIQKIIKILKLQFILFSYSLVNGQNINTELKIIPVTNNKNLEEIFNVINLAYKKVPYLKEDAQRITIQELEEILEDPFKTLFVCIDGNKICGTALLTIIDSGTEVNYNSEMSLLSVHPEHQGKNIGKLIMDHVEKEVSKVWYRFYLHIKVIPLYQEKLIEYYKLNGYEFAGEISYFSEEDLKRYIKPECWHKIYFKTMYKHLKKSSY